MLPDGILGSPGLGYVREWILSNTRILASIDLHPDTFQPDVSIQTSVLVLQRKSHDVIAVETAAGRINNYPAFMAVANHVGYDKRGHKTYVRDSTGNEVIEETKELVKEWEDGADDRRCVQRVLGCLDRLRHDVRPSSHSAASRGSGSGSGCHARYAIWRDSTDVDLGTRCRRHSSGHRASGGSVQLGTASPHRIKVIGDALMSACDIIANSAPPDLLGGRIASTQHALMSASR